MNGYAVFCLLSFYVFLAKHLEAASLYNFSLSEWSVAE